MKNYTDYLIESILEESAKTDFIDKFGQETFNNFEKAKQRLVNNGYSVDFGQYLKKDKKEVDDLILSLYNKKDNKGNDIDKEKRRSLQNKQREVRGKYNFLGEHDGYLVYQPLDYISSMDLGINTGWCTTGRYGHYGHPEYTPSEADAKKHFNDYTSRGIKLYYFLNPDTFYGEYAIALYPNMLFPDEQIFDTESKSVIKVNKTNFKLFNVEDTNIFDYKIKKIANNIGLNLSCDIEQCPDIIIDENGIEIDGKTLVKCWDKNIKIYTVPNSVTSIECCAFCDCSSLTSIEIPNSVTSIGLRAFYNCSSLTSIEIPNSVTSIGYFAFCDCSSLTSIEIPNSVTIIGEYAFCDCSSLTSIEIPNSVTSIGEETFDNCNSLTSIIIPNSVTSIGKYAFSRCRSLKTIYYSGKNPDIIEELAKYADVVDPDTGEVIKIK